MPVVVEEVRAGVAWVGGEGLYALGGEGGVEELGEEEVGALGLGVGG